MQSVSDKLTIAKSQNGITFYGTPWFPHSQEIALTQNTDVAIAIPEEFNAAILYYSAGATVKVSQGLVGDTLSAPSSSFTQTLAKINPPTVMLDTKDNQGNALYLHFFSPNPSDWVIIGFCNYLGYFDVGPL
jgi:hypothetical protein